MGKLGTNCETILEQHNHYMIPETKESYKSYYSQIVSLWYHNNYQYINQPIPSVIDNNHDIINNTVNYNVKHDNEHNHNNDHMIV